jgi:SCP-2 sterol transfer family
MSPIELVLANPARLDEELSLFFQPQETPIAKKYMDALRASQGLAIYNPDRFYNFPNGLLDRRTLSDRINHCVDAINGYTPGLIALRAEPNMDQARLNALHHYFEILRGPVLAPTEFMVQAPLRVKLALEQLNLSIHHFEDHERNEGVVRAGQVPAARIVLTFSKRPRHPLADEDFAHFTKKRSFGSWNINYCEVGKPIWDVYQDKDEVIGDSNVRPLRYYSADAALDFGATVTDAEHKVMMDQFWQWWATNEATLRRLGFERDDPKNAIGAIPVAQLVRDRGAIADKADDQVRELVSRFQYLSRVICHDAVELTDVQRSLERTLSERLARRPDLVRRLNASYQLRITGDGGGEWVIDLTRGEKGFVGRGSMKSPSIEITMAAADFLEVASGRLSTQMAIVQSKLRFEGPLSLALELRELIG